MFSLEQYVKENISLTKSLVIKFADMANAINKGILLNPAVEDKYKKIPEDKRQWKYYMNLAGEKHVTNNDVQILVIEIGEKRSLSKTLLDNYKYTRSELLTGGSFYEELIDAYPDDMLFIHGCMYPVDKDTAIRAKDGKILNYNSNFMNENEYSVLEELEQYCINYLSRWHIREYTLVEELYLPTVLAILYANIPNKLMAIRYDKVFTNEVHPFHMEHFFRSQLGIWDEIKLLDNKSRYWLYNNLKYIRKNIGKTKTFELVIEKILTANKVGIGNFTLRKPLPKLSNTENVNESFYLQRPLMSLSSNLNTYYTTDNNKSSEVSSLVEKELLAANSSTKQEDLKHNEYIIKEVDNIVKDSYVDNQKTKLIEISTYNLFKRQGVDLFKLIIDHWVFSYNYGRLNYLCEYLEPNNNKTYICSPYIGFLILLKLILKKLNLLDIKLTNINYDTVLNPDKTGLDKAYDQLFKDNISQFAYEEMKEYYPNTAVLCNNVDDFTSLISNVVDYYSYVWTVDVNVENILTSATIKGMLQLVTTSGKFDLLNPNNSYNASDNATVLPLARDTREEEVVPKTIDELLEDNNIIYNIDDTFDIDKSISEVVRTFTGITLDETLYIKEVSQGFRALVEKLTSYTIQTFIAETGENSIFVYYNNTNIFKSNLGIVILNDAKLTPLEQEFTLIETYSNDFEDSIEGSVDVGRFTKAASMPKVPFRGYMEIIKNKSIGSCSPTVSIEMLKLPIYDIREGHYSNKFLIDVQARMVPIQSAYVNVNTDARKEIEHKILDANIINNDNNNSISVYEKPARGTKLIAYEEPYELIGGTAPNILVNTGDSKEYNNNNTKGKIIRPTK